MPTTFPLFSYLPSELRNQIWENALPDRIEPALCFYKKGCWLPRRITPSDKDYEEYNPDPDSNLYFEFRHHLLAAIQLENSLYFVNRDARSIALSWMRMRNVNIRRLRSVLAPTFACTFNPVRDVLYVAPDRWDDFLLEAFDRQFEPDLLDRTISSGKMDVDHIAIPAVRLRDDGAIGALVETLEHWFYSVRMLSIVIAPVPNLQFVDDEKTVQRRWELENIEFEKKQEYDGIGKESLDRILKDTQDELAKSGEPRLSAAKIRLAVAVRR